jgi:hypothetical protein
MMIKSILTLLIVSGLCGTIFGTFSVQAADVKVTWTEPGKYRDIYPGNQGRKRFQESTFKELEKHLLKLAKALPESQTLKIDVTDVDLAGDVHASRMRDIRVIKEIYFPRIKFSYKLINEEQAIIQSGDVNIKDMNFMMGISSRYRNKSLGYEIKLLDDWFKDQFVDNMKQ